MMMDVRELVTKFSFQVNSKAVKDFIGLLAKAETSLDNLGKKTTVNAGKARVEGEKRTQRQIDAIQSKWDKRRSDRLKIATRKQQKADKEQLDYEERRSKVLSARDLSRVKRRIKAEETANKLIAKQQEEANKKAEKQQLDYETRRSKVLSARDKQRSDRRALAIKQEQLLQERLRKGFSGGKSQVAGWFDNVYAGRAKEIKATIKEINGLLGQTVQEPKNKGLAFRINAEQSKRLREIQRLRDIRSSNVDFDRAFKPKPSFSSKETENVDLPNLFGKTEKSLSKELDALFKPMAKLQNKVADNQIKVEKKTQEKIADIQKRWDDRRFNRQLKNIRSSNIYFDKAFRPKPSFSAKETQNVGLPDLFSKTEKSLSKELDALLKPMAKLDKNRILNENAITAIEKKRQSELLRGITRAKQEQSKGFQELLFHKGFSNKYANKSRYANFSSKVGFYSDAELSKIADNLFSPVVKSMK